MIFGGTCFQLRFGHVDRHQSPHSYFASAKIELGIDINGEGERVSCQAVNLASRMQYFGKII